MVRENPVRADIVGLSIWVGLFGALTVLTIAWKKLAGYTS